MFGVLVLCVDVGGDVDQLGWLVCVVVDQVGVVVQLVEFVVVVLDMVFDFGLVLCLQCDLFVFGNWMVFGVNVVDLVS